MKYKDAGVDIEGAEEAMKAIKASVRSTYSPRVLGGFGGFGGLFSIADLGMTAPVLVASVDGVGTKLRLSIETGRVDGPGRDIVNHCVNDILVQGARPLFFLDYYATGVLRKDVLAEVVRGMAEACVENGCALLGGETAEMPGFYAPGDFDLAGTIVGVADRHKLLAATRVVEGDRILGLPSTGLHTNGYSLARKALLEAGGYSLDHTPAGWKHTLGQVLTEPHRSYLKSVYPLVEEGLVHALVHLTGGGYQGNIPRVIPPHLSAAIDTRTWTPPAVFELIQAAGNVETPEMYKTFNMGLGMLLITPREAASEILARLEAGGESPVEAGEVRRRGDGEPVVLEF